MEKKNAENKRMKRLSLLSNDNENENEKQR